MLERTDAITNAVLEPVTFVVAYPTVPASHITLCHVSEHCVTSAEFMFIPTCYLTV